jgi:hypothetical protein
MNNLSSFSWKVIGGTLWTVIGTGLEVAAVSVPAEGVPPAVGVPMLPAVAMAEDGPTIAIVAFVVLLDAMLSGAVGGIAAAVAVGGVAVAVAVVARFTARALGALVVLEDLLIVMLFKIFSYLRFIK